MTEKRPFVHLHCHTHYSLLDGANRIPDLVEKTKEMGMNAAAITDHGNLYGAIEFYKTCREHEINPIIGYEAYVAPGNLRDKTAKKMKEASSHLTLLAMNVTGFHNLIKMASVAYVDGFYFKPRIDKALLEEYNEGIICLSGCASSDLSKAILAGENQEAESLIHWFHRVFGDRYYLEIQNAGLEIQRLCMEGTVDWAKKKGLPLVATNDSHYLCQEDAAAHDVLLCVNTRAYRSDANRMKMDNDQFYVRSPEAMYQVFRGYEDAVARSQEIADRCDIQINFKAKHYPVFTPPGGLSDTEYLRQLCKEKMATRYAPAEVTPQHWERLDFELKVIEKMGYSSYFLIVWDFVRFAESQKIPCQARGSACGAIVAYLLGLSNVCPLKYDLLFERFLDPSRTEPPDIDIDFCRDRRQLVIDYTKEKYGKDNVAQIGTFGTLKAKAAIRDVSRALSVPLPRVDEISKMIPETLNITIEEAMEESPDLKAQYEQDPQIKEVIDIAMRLEGLARSAGTHAAGVVVSSKPLANIVPLQMIKGKEDLITQWDGPTVETVGLLKMDFLGLRNLTILDKAVENVKKHRGVEIDPIKLPLDDKATFALLQRGETKGIFQLESGGMRDLLTKMRPDSFHDIIATSALYRPGPLEGGMVMDYVNVKHGRQPIAKVHPIVDEILVETYGVMVYQEQVMRILNRVGDIELPAAYRCIKAISKKKLKIIAQFREEYITGAKKKGIDEKVAIDLFELIEKFAGYGFNKCVVGETEILDAVTGEKTTVGKLFQNQRPFSIHALGEDWQVRVRSVTDVVWNGRKAVYRLTTAQGKAIAATANHPFRTLDGWKNLGDLLPGDRIAAPRRLNLLKGQSLPRHELITLAGLLSEGNTCHPSCLYFYNNDQQMIDDFVEAVEQFPETVARVSQRGETSRKEVCVSTGRDARFQPGQVPWNAAGSTQVLESTRSGAYRWAESLGILKKTATEKVLPATIFQLPDSDLGLFLGRLWSGDGYIGNQGQMPYYATSSRQLAQDIQTLLLRLGILSGVHQKTMKYRWKDELREREGFTVHLIGSDSIRLYAERILPHVVGRDEQTQRFRNYLAVLPESRSSKDTIPAEVREWVDAERRRAGVTWRELEAESGVCVRGFTHKNGSLKKGFRRETVRRLAEFFASERLGQLAESEVFWDTVVSIESCGVQDTYDLTVEQDHNFVANGLIVHNSHSTAYGAVAYQTAYLKAHYPVEFMAALLSCGMESDERIYEHVDDCRRMKIDVLPPDVNRSDVEFAVLGEKIIFGMGAIKGVGEETLRAIVNERKENGPYRSIYDLCARNDPKVLTRAALEILIKAGALDSLGPHRAQHMIAVERAVQSAVSAHRDKVRGQINLFGDEDEAPQQADAPAEENLTLPETTPWTHGQKLRLEKEVIGFYLTSHPLMEFAAQLEAFAQNTVKQMGDMEDRTDVMLGGMISAVKLATSKNPNRNGHTRYANFDLEDATGIVRCIAWPEEYARMGEKIKAEQMVICKGRVDRRGREPNVIVNKIWTLEEAAKEFTDQLAIKFQRGLHTAEDMVRVRDVLNRYPGKTEVVLVVVTSHYQKEQTQLKYLLKAPQDMKVSCNSELRAELDAALGEGFYQFIAPRRSQRNGNGNGHDNGH